LNREKTGGRKPETGDRRQETGDRRQEEGGRVERLQGGKAWGVEKMAVKFTPAAAQAIIRLLSYFC